LAIIGWIAGQLIVQKWSGNGIYIAAILFMAVCAIYIVRLPINNLSDLRLFESRASLWDQRNVTLQQAQAQGISKADAITIDTKGWEVEDMLITGKRMNGQWVNNCFSEYYGLDAVRAVTP
jgi:hypothetical protein